MRWLVLLLLCGFAQADCVKLDVKISESMSDSALNGFAQVAIECKDVALLDAVRTEQTRREKLTLIKQYNQLVDDYNRMLTLAKSAAAQQQTKVIYQPLLVESPRSPLRCNAFTLGELTTINCR